MVQSSQSSKHSYILNAILKKDIYILQILRACMFVLPSVHLVNYDIVTLSRYMRKKPSKISVALLLSFRRKEVGSDYLGFATG